MTAALAMRTGLPGTRTDTSYTPPDDLATRYDDMVKLQMITGEDGTPAGGYTTTRVKEIVMPFHDSASANLDAAIRDIARTFEAQPRPKRVTKRVQNAVRRGATRAATDLPWLAVPSLYFMQCTTCGLVKVGVSGDYRLRRIELQKRTGHTLTVLGFGYGTLEIEASVHGWLSPWRVEGEWYRPSEDVLAYARGLRYGPDGKLR